jgi:hypothetical protein
MLAMLAADLPVRMLLRRVARKPPDLLNGGTRSPGVRTSALLTRFLGAEPGDNDRRPRATRPSEAACSASISSVTVAIALLLYVPFNVP